jgi:hypothetical protein
MKEGFVPSIREIGAKKVSQLLARFQDQPFHARVLEVMGEDWKENLSAMSPEQVAAHFIALMMPDVFGGEDSRKTKRATRERPAAPVPAASPSPRPVAPPAPVPQPRVVPKAPVTPKKPALFDGPSVFDVKDARPVRSRTDEHPKLALRQRVRPNFGPRPASKRVVAVAPVKAARRPAAPSNFTKKPKDLPGPARSTHEAELPELNRRARRAAKFANRALEVESAL